MKHNFFIALLVLPLLGCPSGEQKAQTSSSTPAAPTVVAPPFNADTAFAYLRKQVEFGPRVAGTPGHRAQLDWMKSFLGQRADVVEVQDFQHQHTRSHKALAMTNLFARFNPDARDRILLIAHWDTRPTADQDSEENSERPIPGANDGASGVALLLEIANVLKRQKPGIGVDLLFVDGEDYGPDSDNMYLGATHFAAKYPNYRPLYGILVDMIADQNPVFPIEGNSQDSAPEVIERVWKTAEQLGLSSAFPRRSGGYITDDHIPLNKAGIRTIDIIDFDYPHWHKMSDDLSAVSPRGLELVGKVLLQLIYSGG